jgi:hypothetical protein
MRLRFIFIWATLALMMLVSGAWAQSTSGKTPRQPTQNERLAKPISWGYFPVHFFKDSHVVMTFTLRTSWISGENHKGMFRYKLDAYPNKSKTIAEMTRDTELDTPEKIESFVKRVNRCYIYLSLYDSDGFRLRGIPVFFQLTVNSEGQVEGLSANLDAQMDAEDYRKFIGSASTSGSWDISYTCAELP